MIITNPFIVLIHRLGVGIWLQLLEPFSLFLHLVVWFA